MYTYVLIYTQYQARVDIIDVFRLLVAEALELLCVLADLCRFLADLHACACMCVFSVFAGKVVTSNI